MIDQSARVLATFNVNGVNGRLPRLLEWLHERAPDVACLQEIRTSDPKFPIDSLRSAGYQGIWHGQRAHHGVAILAKGEIPIEVSRGMPGDDDDKQARFIEADIHGLRVASIYLPNGNPVDSPSYEYKLDWFQRLQRFAETSVRSKKPVVLAGDLNVVPTDFDIYYADRWRFDAVLQPAVRALFGTLLRQGWTDAIRSLYPHDPMYSYWINEADHARDRGWRLDFLLLNPSAAARLMEAGVDAAHRSHEKPSDHAPVWIRLRTV